MKIVIVEDEPFAQQELLRLIKNSEEDFEVLAMIDSVEDSLEWFATNDHPDLVFLDIQLADGLSFDIFREVELRSAVIFTTAYDEYAIKAFKLNSIDYLLKPVKQEALDAALGKFRKMKKDIGSHEGGLDQKQIEQLLKHVAQKEYKQRIMIRIGDQIKSIDIRETAYFKADDNVVFLVDRNGHKYIIEYTLEQLEKMLDPQKFFRLNRGFVVAFDAIKKVSKYFNSRLLILLDPEDEDKVLVSRARIKDFLEWLDQ